MDKDKFDELIARLAEGPSRRDALKGILGGALASVGVSSLAEGKGKGKKGKGRDLDAEGGETGLGLGGRHKKNKKNNGGNDKKKHKKKKKCTPTTGQTRCSRKVCTNLQTDRNNCGVCGRRCTSAQTCTRGTCVAVTTTTRRPTTTTAPPTTTTAPPTTTTAPPTTTTPPPVA
jgi:hypothetical protein